MRRWPVRTGALLIVTLASACATAPAPVPSGAPGDAMAAQVSALQQVLERQKVRDARFLAESPGVAGKAAGQAFLRGKPP